MSIFRLIASSAIITAGLSVSTAGHASVDPLLGEIMAVGYTYCPRGWMNADGQLLAISSNAALYSLYRTTYGGDGRTTFALPDLRGRTPIHMGQIQGGNTYTLGQKGGTETNVMLESQMPSHTHGAGIQTTGTAADSNKPATNSFGNTTDNVYVDNAEPNRNFMRQGTILIQNAGGGQPQNNMQPFLTVRYCVATVGAYPSRP